MQDLLDVEISPVIYVSALGILGCLGLGVIKEAIQVYQQKWMYLLDPINLVTWILYGAAMVMVSSGIFVRLNDVDLGVFRHFLYLEEGFMIYILVAPPLWCF